MTALLPKKILLLIAALMVVLAAPAQAIEPVFSDDGLAIRGYDPVAYFTQGEPVEGKSNFTHQWMGTTWQFADAANRDAFAANPERYAPQFGGYCAWAVSQGYTASIDPDAWDIHDGKLYLNYSKRVQRRWKVDKISNIATGNRNWPKIKSGG